MDDRRRRMLAVVSIVIGLFILVAIVAAVITSGKKVVSPIPEDTDAIKIIFISPTNGPTARP